jgi:hypothetical protein
MTNKDQDNRTNEKIKSPQELRLVKGLAKLALELIDKGKKIFLPNGSDKNIDAERPASSEDVVDAIAAGIFNLFYHYVGSWPEGTTEDQKDKWLSENPHYCDDDQGNVYKHYGEGGAPAKRLQGRETLTEALMPGGYLPAAANVIPFDASPIKGQPEPTHPVMPENPCVRARRRARARIKAEIEAGRGRPRRYLPQRASLRQRRQPQPGRIKQRKLNA